MNETSPPSSSPTFSPTLSPAAAPSLSPSFAPTLAPFFANDSMMYNASSPSAMDAGYYSTTPLEESVPTALILIVCGFILWSAGYRLLKPVLFVSAAALVGVVVYYLLDEYAPSVGAAQWWLPFAIAGALALAAGCLALCLLRAGIAMLGFLLGFLAAAAFLAVTQLDALQSTGAEWGVLLGGGFLGACAALVFERFTVITATSFVGAFAATVGVDLLMHAQSAAKDDASTQFGLSAVLSDVLREQDSRAALTKLNETTVLIELIVVLVATALGMFVQYRYTGKRKRRKKKKRGDEDDDDQGLLDAEGGDARRRRGAAAARHHHHEHVVEEHHHHHYRSGGGGASTSAARRKARRGGAGGAAVPMRDIKRHAD